jgi:hypothetical protein
MNIEKKRFINPIDEFNHLYKLHTFNSKKSASLLFFKKILKKSKKTGDNNVKDDEHEREDWNKLFNKKIVTINKVK